MNQDRSNERRQARGRGMAIGIALGLLMGLVLQFVLSLVTGSPAEVRVFGFGGGLVLGVAIGTALESRQGR